MDDLNSKLNDLLNDPQALDQIKGLSQMLFSNNETNASAKKNNNSESLIKNALSELSGDRDNTLSIISNFAPLLKDMNKEDDTTRLLYALRPFLSDERKKKLDQAGKIMKIMKLLPLLKDSSILDSLL